MIHSRRDAELIFQDALLDALDKAALRVFGSSAEPLCAGANDTDLPELFGTLHAQMDRLAERYDHPLIDHHITTAAPIARVLQ